MNHQSRLSKPVVDDLVRDLCRQLGYDPARPPVHVGDREAAQALGATPGTLCTWRSTGRYAIPFVKVGSKVRYPLRGLAEFMARRTYYHTTM
jgi:hypothetical protein